MPFVVLFFRGRTMRISFMVRGNVDFEMLSRARLGEDVERSIQVQSVEAREDDGEDFELGLHLFLHVYRDEDEF